MFEDTALGVGNPQSGLQRWWKELPGTMAAYCKIFPVRLDRFVPLVCHLGQTSIDTVITVKKDEDIEGIRYAHTHT